MQKIRNLALALLLVLAGVTGMVQPTFAEEGEQVEEQPERMIGISPTAIMVTLKSGDTLEGQSDECPTDLDAGCAVEIKNLGTQSLRYRLYVTPYVISGEDYELSFSEEDATSYTQISRWVSFRNSDGEYVDELILTIKPGETQTIYYRIQVPEDVPGGAQYAAIWAQTLNDGAGSGVQATAQAGAVIYGRSIGSTRQTAEVTDYDFTRFTFGGSLKAEATIVNTGNTDFNASYTYTARTIFGKELYSDSGAKATFPDTSYHVEMEWENTPLLGIFQVEFKIEAADMVKTERHIVVIMPIFVMILLILLLTVIIVWIIIIIRKRKERKARTLV